jgi:carbon storage regulator
MLVLSRKVGERIQIGDHVSVVIVRINGNAVRVGIEAPTDMTVIRTELQQRTSQPAIAAGSVDPDEADSLCEESPAS